jgi:hypothetical protein
LVKTPLFVWGGGGKCETLYCARFAFIRAKVF